MDFRIGIGYDVHRLVEGRNLILGGLQIPYSKGLLGHSDADVLLHAICDAMLGALALGDIGKHFPDDDSAYKNVDSKLLLHKTNELIKAKKYKVNNVDASICAQNPKLQAYIPGMRKIIANILQIGIDKISIKATTTEKLGYIGKNKAISTYAIVSLLA